MTAPAPVTRRMVLVGAGTAGALVVALALVPRGYRAPLAAGPGEHVIEGLIRLARNGTISVAVPATEMGQGIATLAAQIVAVELGADWRRVGVEPAPVSAFYADPVIAAQWAGMWLPHLVAERPGLVGALAGAPGDLWVRHQADGAGAMITACGTTLAAFEPRLRRAAAALRQLLVAAAAAETGLAISACDTRDHQVICGTRRLPFARLIDSALAAAVPDAPTLRAHPAREAPDAPPGRLAAPDFPRIDLPAKVDGSLVYAGDVRLPGLVHAAIAHAPQGHCHLASHDAAAARRIPGLIAVVPGERWIATVAKTWHAADRALTAIDPLFRIDGDGQGRVVDSGAIDLAIETALHHGDATRLFAAGDPDPLLTRPMLSARYDIAPALHAPLEPASATARLSNGQLELWIATQAPDAAARAAARAAGVARGAVTVYPMPAGGSFDSRLDVRIAAEVAEIARRCGHPVQLTWSRWQETLAGFPRAPFSAVVDTAFDPAHQRLIGWRARIATPASALESGARLFGDATAHQAQQASAGSADPMAVAGAMPVYAIPDRAVDHLPLAISLPVGRMRGGSDAHAAFITETMIDECAHFAGAEPLSFRIAMLGQQPRLAACLQGAASLAMWGGGGGGSGQGIACHTMTLAAPEGPRSGHIALVVSAHADAGAIRVDSVAAFCDIGRIINRDIARQQIEGGILFGMAQALGGSTRWNAGLPQAARIGQLRLPLLADCPKVVVAFAASDDEPFDPGDLATVAIAPAIGNAVFSASGVRLRRLPFLSEGV